jgi:hypothetical protein
MSGYMTTAGVIGLVQCGFPKPALIGVFGIGFIGFRVLEALNVDKSKNSFPPAGDVERSLLATSVVLGIIASTVMKFC